MKEHNTEHVRPEPQEPLRKPVPYSGDDPFIFISYSHRDTGLVWPILLQMQKDGYRFWYDDGIEAGATWDDIIGEHVLSGGYFIAFLSEAYLSSGNCQQELKFALSENKPVLTVFLRQLTLPAGLKMRLSTSRAVFYNSEDELDFFEKLGDAQDIGLFRTSAEEEEARPTFKDLSDRCSKVLKASCYCEALYLEREAIDVCLMNCLYHLGFLYKPSSSRIRSSIRPLLLSLGEEDSEAESPIDLGIASLENKLEILKHVFIWAKRQSDMGRKSADKELQAIAVQLNQMPLEHAIEVLRDVDRWRTEARSITRSMSSNKLSMSAKSLPIQATEGHRCVHELAKVERAIRKGSRIRRALDLPTE